MQDESGMPLSAAAHERELREREAFVHFLMGVLNLDPKARWTPRQVSSSSQGHVTYVRV